MALQGDRAESAPSLGTEISAGVTTFFTMAYIVVVNPSILATEGTGMSFSGVLTATVLVCASSTLLMGLYARLPFALAPGMGINAFVTYGIILGRGVDWRIALGLVFWSGVIFMALSVTPVREHIARAIPHTLRTAAAAGIGLFLTFIGLKNAAVITSHPVTFVSFAPLSMTTLLFAVGLLTAVFFLKRKSSVSLLAAIATVALLAIATGESSAPQSFVSMPDFSSMLLELDIMGALQLSLVPLLLALLFTDLFDSISTFVGVAEAANLKDEYGQPKNLRQGLIVDAFATLSAGLFGSSSGTTYIESAAGIEAGGRTGRTAVVCALCFIPCLFLGPTLAAIPAVATAPVLVLVGALMFRPLLKLDLSKLEDLLPVFVTVVCIPLTFSITQGMLWGFVTYAATYLLSGRGRELSKTMLVLACASIGMLLLDR